MTGPWLIALLVAAVLALTVFDLLVSFDWKSYLARGLGAVQAADDPTDEYETLAEFCGYDNACILCHRLMPDEKLEYIVAARPEMWCVDLATCKAWRDEWMGAMQ